MRFVCPVPGRLPAAGLLAVLATVSAAADAPPKGQRIFVTGHSFHMPIIQPLDQAAHAAAIAGHRIVGSQGIGGSSVSQHWDAPEAVNKAKQAIKTGGVDVLTVAPNTLMPDPAIDQFTALLLEHNPNGRVVVQASWLPFDGGPRKGTGFKNADRDKATPEDLRKAATPWLDKLREQVNGINDRYAKRAGGPVAFVVPVGEAVVRLRERVAKGEVPGIARQSELFKDDLGHGQAPVYVLNAYCHYAVIYRRSPAGLPVPDMLKQARLGEDAEKVNQILQEIAWQAVTAEPLSGVKAAKAE